MGFFGNKKEGGLMDVIRCDLDNYLVWKWRPSGEANSTRKENSIRFGSSLRVKEGEVAVFVYKQGDTLMDFIKGPHDSIIETNNFPVLTNLVGHLWGGDSPFQAEIYFINLQGNNQLRFAVPYFDVADPRFPDFTVPVAVRGTITFNISDYREFIKLNRLIDFDLEKFYQQIKATVALYTKNVVTNCPFDNNIPLQHLERKVLNISDLINARLASVFENDFGIRLKRFDISAIEIDKESNGYGEFARITKEQQAQRAEIDTRQYERISRLSAESQFIQAHAIDQQAEVLKAAAQSMGEMGGIGGGEGMNPAGMMMGMAMGGALGSQMTGMMNNLGQQQTPPPSPAQGTTLYMVAVNGQQYGPYNMQQMQQMAQCGQINASVLIWTQGMPQWATAGSIPELAGLFSMTPPPIPPIL